MIMELSLLSAVYFQLVCLVTVHCYYGVNSCTQFSILTLQSVFV